MASRSLRHLTASLFLGGGLFVSVLQLQAASVARAYVSSHLPAIMARHDRFWGISCSEGPRISYSRPLLESNPLSFLSGGYDPATSTIYLNLQGAYTPTSPLLRAFQRFRFGGNDVHRTLDHELAHYYCDQLSRSRFHVPWPAMTPTKSPEALLANRLLAEGIAVYVDRRLNVSQAREQRPPPPRRDLAGSSPQNIYEEGYALVQPLLDSYRADALLYLLTHAPNDAELRDRALYQSRAIAALRERPVSHAQQVSASNETTAEP